MAGLARKKTVCPIEDEPRISGMVESIGAPVFLRVATGAVSKTIPVNDKLLPVYVFVTAAASYRQGRKRRQGRGQLVGSFVTDFARNDLMPTVQSKIGP